MKIYLASSWRNPHQPDVLAQLRAAGHDVYDFRNPAPGDHGFSWRQCDPELKDDLTVGRLRRALAHPAAARGFKYDFDAMQASDACVLLLPSGMSAHLEAGWLSGSGKLVAVVAPELREPELMYKCFDADGTGAPIFATAGEALAYLIAHASPPDRSRFRNQGPMSGAQLDQMARAAAGPSRDWTDHTAVEMTCGQHQDAPVWGRYMLRRGVLRLVCSVCKKAVAETYIAHGED